MLSKNFALLAASVVLITSSPSFASPVFFYRAGNGDISEHIDRITDQKSEIMLSIPTLNVGDSLSANASYRGDGGSVTWSCLDDFLMG